MLSLHRVVRARTLCRFLPLLLAVVAFPGTAGAATAAQATLAWDPVVDDRLGGYYLHVGFSSGAYHQKLDVGNVTRHTLAGLENGRDYFFAASAYDKAKTMESTLSNEVSLRTPPAAPALASIAVSGPAQVNENSTAQYTCRATYADSSSQDVTAATQWQENCPAATISTSGLLSTASVSANQSCTLTATYQGKSATFAVTMRLLLLPPWLRAVLTP